MQIQEANLAKADYYLAICTQKHGSLGVGHFLQPGITISVTTISLS